MTPRTDWTREKIAELTKLWAGDLPTPQIGRALGGLSKNAVIGKAYRLGLPSRVPLLGIREIRRERRRREMNSRAHA